MASADKTVHCWDLGSNQKVQVASHDAPVRTVHWVKTPTYSCIMTGSWDKTLKVFLIQQHIPAFITFVAIFMHHRPPGRHLRIDS